MYKILKWKEEAEARHGNRRCTAISRRRYSRNVGNRGSDQGEPFPLGISSRSARKVELSNTYHLHVRPGDEVVKKMGGLHKFMVWDKPILTDSGGFRYSLAGPSGKSRREGVYFPLPRRRKKDLYGTGGEYADQSNLASTIAMAFDECPSSGRPTLCAEFRGPYGKMAAAMQG